MELISKDRLIWWLEYKWQTTSNYQEALSFAEVIECVKGMKPVNEWVPCSERLPERCGNYLITVRAYDETANIDYITTDHANSDGSFTHYKAKKNPKAKHGKIVIAWQPLPEPYKED